MIGLPDLLFVAALLFCTMGNMLFMLPFYVLGGLLLGGLTGGHHDYGGWGGPDLDLDFDFFD